ncbi:hypothetical protein EV363DRAFT_1434297 [Boletus edulis]|nr:hypothetical protein EV363DRAFT_1434297 [Boletus edulis]
MKLCMKHPRLGSLRRFLDSVPLSRSLLFHLTPFDLHLHLASILVVELRVHILSLRKHWVSWPKSLFCIYCAHSCILLALIHLLHPPSLNLPHRIS